MCCSVGGLLFGSVGWTGAAVAVVAVAEFAEICAVAVVETVAVAASAVAAADQKVVDCPVPETQSLGPQCSEEI